MSDLQRIHSLKQALGFPFLESSAKNAKTVLGRSLDEANHRLAHDPHYEMMAQNNVLELLVLSKQDRLAEGYRLGVGSLKAAQASIEPVLQEQQRIMEASIIASCRFAEDVKGTETTLKEEGANLPSETYQALFEEIQALARPIYTADAELTTRMQGLLKQAHETSRASVLAQELSLIEARAKHKGLILPKQQDIPRLTNALPPYNAQLTQKSATASGATSRHDLVLPAV